MSADTTAITDPPLPRSRLLGYSIGSVGTGVFSTVPGLLLLYYLTDVLGVSAAIAGAALVLPKAWDVILNPIVGAASDREAVRTGRRSRLLLTGAVALPVLFAAMFAVPGSSPALAAAWVMTAFLLAASAFACFQVPYVALPAEISPRPDQRARAMTWRIVAVTFGILVGGGLAPVVVEAAGGGRAGYALMGVLVGLVMAVVMLTSVRATRWIPSRSGPRPLGLVAALRTAWGNRPFFALLGSAILQFLAVAVMLAGAPYAATYLLDDYGLTSAMFVCLVAPSAPAVPVWNRLAARYGYVRCYAVAAAAYAAGAAALYPALRAGSIPAVLALAGLLGICYAALQLLSFSLVPESVHADSDRTGHAQAGAFTGVWTAAETAAMAAGPGVFALVLALSSYRASDFDEPVVQPDSALTGLAVGFTWLPAALMLVSLPLLLAYRNLAARRYRAHAGRRTR
ncbi:MFS transporter [Thermomonospora curvata]|uniref:Major facilitator superfamily MFS_1 n=1 Tax=Thermomonospora curvata (strain ATCC 19995 / DSM 43183 / JCM 3096 / KCTC 9072 / NBRC 15933 / NCIMB 10081 / Henssen B9) TaxID=471852 RepID=D1AE65_THECD|nr:MFS transporter [Thermomonospora curvata]ACY99491.1 major facilitator superfamily MFS_1 [Thermomonospora curvata DSM 43183]